VFPTTKCTVVEVIPEKKLALRVNTNRTSCGYALPPTGLIESRDGVTAFSKLSINALFGGTANSNPNCSRA
jgi:hypothetical protein